MVSSSPAACLTEEVLAAWVSGRLSASELPRVEAHVAGCPVCLRRIGERMGEAPSDPESPFDQATTLTASEARTLGAYAQLDEKGKASGSVASAGATRAAVPRDTSPELLLERYELTELIAQGGMGDIYRGFDRLTGTGVAIKRLKAGLGAHPEHLARFVREAEILRRLDHPNIVKMLAIVEGGDGAAQHSIVMEYVAGGSLRRELARRPVLPQIEALLLTLEIAEALSGAHGLHVIHRDIKPENVLIAADGTVRLVDFGLARMGDQRFTAPGSLLGTVAYLSPEVLWGHEVDERTDLWSLGVMLFEMLSGERPFVASTPGATLTAIVREPVPELRKHCPDAPPALLELTSRMLQKHREQRIGSAGEVVSAIETILESLVLSESCS